MTPELDLSDFVTQGTRVQVMHDSALAVRRPGECTFFTSGCEVSVDKVEFTPQMIQVRCAAHCGSDAVSAWLVSCVLCVGRPLCTANTSL